MSQSEISKATAADARSESARSFVRTVKAATRRKYPPEREDPYCARRLPPGGDSE